MNGVALDLPGHSSADRWYEITSRPGVEKIGDFIRGDETIAVGWSLGGNLLLSLALQRPENLRALVLVGSTPSYVKRRNFSFGQPRSVVKKMKKDLIADFQETMERFYRSNFSETEKKEKGYQEHIEILRNSQKGIVKEDIIMVLDALIDDNIVKSIASINIPTLLIHGSMDTVCPLEASEYLLEKMPKAELVVMEEAGHAPFLTRPKEFNRILEDFVGKFK